MFKIEFSRQSIKFLKNADKILQKRVIKKIGGLKKKPILHDSKSIEGYKEKLYRVRVGSYRILYEVDSKNNIIGVVKIDKRSKAY